MTDHETVYHYGVTSEISYSPTNVSTLDVLLTSTPRYNKQSTESSNITIANTADPDTDLLEHLQQASKYTWVVLSPVLFVIGCIGNILILLVLKKLVFWRKPAYIFLAILALSDFLVLCVGLLKYWIQETFDLNVRNLSNAGCKINLFVIYWSMQLSSWILVCVVCERFLKTNFPLRYSRLVNIRRCIAGILSVCVTLAGINLHFFWTNGLKTEEGSIECTSLTEAYFQFEEKYFTYIDFAFLSVIPFILMGTMNIFIYKVIRQSRKFRRTTVMSQQATTDKLKRFDMRLTKMLLFSSVYFLITTTPISVYFIVDSYVKLDDLGEAKKDIVWTICYLLQFSNYAFNIFIYNLTNNKFKNKLKDLCGCIVDGKSRWESHSQRRSTTSSLQTTMTSINSLQSSMDEFVTETRDISESEGYI